MDAPLILTDSPSLLASSSVPGATGNFSAMVLVIQWSLTGFQ